MSNQEDDFLLLVSPQEFKAVEKERDQLKIQCLTLRKEQDRLFQEKESTNAQISMLTDQLEKARKWPQKIAHLSKTLLRMGRVLVDAQEEGHRMKMELEGRPTNEQFTLLVQEKERLWSGKQKDAQQAVQNLREHNESLSCLLQKGEETRQQLQKELTERESEVLKLQQKLADKRIRQIQLLEQVGKLQEDVKEKQYLISNERTIIKQKENKLQQKKNILLHYENLLQQKQKDIIIKYEQLQNIKKDQQIFLQERAKQLKLTFEQKKQLLEQEYTKKIASINDFASNDDQIERLKQQIAKLNEQNFKKQRRICKLKKENDQANKLTFVLEHYEDPHNAEKYALSFSLKSLTIFRDQLKAIGESNIAEKIQLKRRQMQQILKSKLSEVLKG